MGESCKDALRPDLDCKLKLEFHGTKVTSDAVLRVKLRTHTAEATTLSKAHHMKINISMRKTE